MNIRRFTDYLMIPIDLMRPLQPQYRSRQAWLDHCKAHGLPPDGGNATLPKELK